MGSVGSVDAAMALLSPVRMERSNLRSLEMVRRRMSAGTLEPMVILTTSPATRSAAAILPGEDYIKLNDKRRESGGGTLYLNVLLSRVTRMSVGSIPDIDDMTRPVE